MTKKPTRAELVAENKLLRSSQRLGSVATIANNVIRFGGLVWIAYFAYLSVDALAGKTTGADIGVSFLADVKVSNAVAWILGGSGAVYGMRQRSLRRDTIARLHARIKQLETQIDEGRTSSGLTERGETNPEDRV